MSENIENDPKTIKMPIWLSLAVVFGLIIGIYVGRKTGNESLSSGQKGLIDEAMHHISNEYVDTVNLAELQQSGIEAMLEKLDPHSAYIPPKDLQVAQASL